MATTTYAAEREPRLVEIPVRYGGESGPDLADVARHAGLSEERVVELHSAGEYLVYFVGFATCFPYLGGLPPELATPRLAAPRKYVPAGSVAIGGSQAGIYPLGSPGGWRLIGRTPLQLFDPAVSPPPLLRMGDRVHFVPVRDLRR
jgi:KipI family sensor histidine kinase inhibitor